TPDRSPPTVTSGCCVAVPRATRTPATTSGQPAVGWWARRRCGHARLWLDSVPAPCTCRARIPRTTCVTSRSTRCPRTDSLARSQQQQRRCLLEDRSLGHRAGVDALTADRDQPCRSTLARHFARVRHAEIIGTAGNHQQWCP